MNWYKIAKDFTNRNIINRKIKFLKSMKKRLDYLKKYVFQNGTHTKKIILSYIYDKKISSYPALRDSLIDASNTVLDSPHRFGNICNNLIGRIEKQIYKLKKERREFDNPDSLNKAKKGWL